MTTFYGIILGVIMATMAARASGARVVSGQTVCSGGPERPCYKIAYFHDVSSRVAFREARQACEMDGGSLLSIESPAEQRDIENLLQELRSGAVGGAGGGAGGIADGDFWIGLTRVDGVDQTHPELSNTFTSCPQLYHWTDGSVASFRNWYFDEPSCGGEACVVMYHQPTALPGLGGAYLYQWNDDRCNMKHNFICKYEPESHLVKEQGDTPGGRGTEATAGGGVVKQSAGSEEAPPQVTMAGASGMLLVHVHHPHNPPAAAHPGGFWDLLFSDAQQKYSPHQDRHQPIKPVDLPDAQTGQHGGLTLPCDITVTSQQHQHVASGGMTSLHGSTNHLHHTPLMDRRCGR